MIAVLRAACAALFVGSACLACVDRAHGEQSTSTVNIAKPTDSAAPIADQNVSTTHVPSGLRDDNVVTFGGEIRERYEYIKGGLTPTTPSSALLTRLMLDADVRLGSNVRGFLQVAYHGVEGRDIGRSALDGYGLDLQQGYVDILADPTVDQGLRFRVGRQELAFGSGRFVSVREGANVRRSFDGLRGSYRSEKTDLDLFATRPVQLRSGTFDDEPDTHQAFWGSYVVHRFAPSFNTDAYYFGTQNKLASYSVGTGDEKRHTTGVRLWGETDRFDYNVEGVYQFGGFATRNISAWGASADLGWNFSNVLFTPRLGLKGNIESGNKNPNGRTLQTFNPLFPNYAYFSEAPLGGPVNSIDTQPNLRLDITPDVVLLAAVDVFWKQSRSDSVYTNGLRPIVGSSGKGNYTGLLSKAHLSWIPRKQVELNAEYDHFEPSKAFHSAGARLVDFALASVVYRF